MLCEFTVPLTSPPAPRPTGQGKAVLPKSLSTLFLFLLLLFLQLPLLDTAKVGLPNAPGLADGLQETGTPSRGVHHLLWGSLDQSCRDRKDRQQTWVSASATGPAKFPWEGLLQYLDSISSHCSFPPLLEGWEGTGGSPRTQAEGKEAGAAVEEPSPYLQALCCCSPHSLSGPVLRVLWAGAGAAEEAPELA